jgi:phage baseplate assembly protein gpV
MSRLIEMLRAIIRHEMKGRTFCEFGMVDSVFDKGSGDDAHSVSVTLKDSGLALPRIPLASGCSGMSVLPRQGDLVLVVMPRGDLSSAVALSQVYSEKRRPPQGTADEAVLVWPGDTDDADNKAIDLRISSDGTTRSFTIKLGGNKDATFTVSDGSITLKAGGVQVAVTHSSSSDGQVEISAGGTTITAKQDGDCTVQSAGTLKLKGASVKIEGDTDVTINGQTVGIN